jgi:hypothetical protein
MQGYDDGGCFQYSDIKFVDPPSIGAASEVTAAFRALNRKTWLVTLLANVESKVGDQARKLLHDTIATAPARSFRNYCTVSVAGTQAEIAAAGKTLQDEMGAGTIGVMDADVIRVHEDCGSNMLTFTIDKYNQEASINQVWYTLWNNHSKHIVGMLPKGKSGLRVSFKAGYIERNFQTIQELIGDCCMQVVSEDGRYAWRKSKAAAQAMVYIRAIDSSNIVTKEANIIEAALGLSGVRFKNGGILAFVKNPHELHGRVFLNYDICWLGAPEVRERNKKRDGDAERAATVDHVSQTPV